MDTKFDVIGIAGILPLDHLFILPASESVKEAREQILASFPFDGDQPNVGFPFQAYWRSGGGRIANILAYLGTHQHRVAACGVVGEDLPGRIVIEDLGGHNVDTSLVRRSRRKRTRVIFILQKASSKEHRQFAPKTRGSAIFSADLLESLPPSQVFLFGRANQGAIKAARRLRSAGSIIAFHLKEAPWRDTERAALLEMLRLVDILIASRQAARSLGGDEARPSSGLVKCLADRTSATLKVVYGGIDEVSASHRGGSAFNVHQSQYIEVTDDTGMMDCFHAALLSFLASSSWQIDDPDVVRAALEFATEVAAFSGTGLGARHFPLTQQHDYMRNRYWNKISTRHSCFISHSTQDADRVRGVVQLLDARPGVKAWVNAAAAGDTVTLAIEKALRGCDEFIIFVSRAAADSKWVRQETRLAQQLMDDGKLRILPLLIEPVKDGSLPAFWRRCAEKLGLNRELVYLDARPPISAKTVFEEIANVLDSPTSAPR